MSKCQEYQTYAIFLNSFSFKDVKYDIHKCPKSSDSNDQMTVYADLNGWRVNGGTIPQDLVLTEQIPDLVIIDRLPRTGSGWRDTVNSGLGEC